MNTPIYNFLFETVKKEPIRFFMPGHKGNFPHDTLAQISKYDITEIEGADSLFDAEGIIKESEENTKELYDSGVSCFSTGGSTLSIQTMVSLVAKPTEKIIAARNAHVAFINACVLLDITPCWVAPHYNDNMDVSGEVLASDIELAILKNKDAVAVYITSPDYLGCMSDIKSISAVCKKYNKKLLVDNAHGAHLKFLKEDCHPITLGADLCCDSAHKTLPALTGGGYLHVAKTCDIKREKVKENMHLFGSTSPSYLILLSLDLNNRYLFEQAKKDFIYLSEEVSSFWKNAKTKGLEPICRNFDLTKLTLNSDALNMTGKDLAEYFRQHNIEPEYVGSKHVVLMVSPQNTKEDFKRLKLVINELSRGIKPLEKEDFSLSIPTMKTSPRQAFFSETEVVEVECAIGRISAENKIKCPPGVPIVICGEEIDVTVQKNLKKSSILKLNVIK